MNNTIPFRSFIKWFTLAISSLLILGNYSFANGYKAIIWGDLLEKSNDQEIPLINLMGSDSIHDSELLSPEVVQSYIEQQEKRLPNKALQGAQVSISGFVVPLEWDQDAKISELLLVPYYGACIHVPPPPKNQIIHVRLKVPQKGIQTMDSITVLGTITMEHNRSDYGDSAYSLVADDVQQNLEGRNKAFLLSTLLTLTCALSISFGVFIGVFVQKKSRVFMGVLLSFSGGTMIYLGLAAIFVQRNLVSLGLFLSGVIALFMLHQLLHRTSTQHHHHSGGRVATLAIIAHNIPECFIVFSTAMVNLGLGALLAITVMCHNIPLGCALSLPDGRNSKKHQLYHAFFSALMPVIIAIFIYQFIRSLLSVNNLINISIFAGGLMFYVAVKEIMPVAYQFGKKWATISGFSIAIIIMSILTVMISIGG